MNLPQLPKHLPSDEALLKTFLTSSVLGIGGLIVAPLVPIAVTGMAISQGLFWSKRLTEDSDVTE
jgi:hypothetical protein